MFFKKRYLSAQFIKNHTTFNFYPCINLSYCNEYSSIFFLKTNHASSPVFLSFFRNVYFFFFSKALTLKYLWCFFNLAFIKAISGLRKLNTFVRSSGSCAKIINKLNNQTSVILPSKKLKFFSSDTVAIQTFDIRSLDKFERFGKAGYQKYFFLKPCVRGTAKNARDHPHGGRTRGGRPKKSPWGWIIH